MVTLRLKLRRPDVGVGDCRSRDEAQLTTGTLARRVGDDRATEQRIAEDSNSG